ncbi:MAG: DNA repair protein RecO [Tissierellia bacterium]|nr:DNA repair protein RecO [Tissierellia bacterium]
MVTTKEMTVTAIVIGQVDYKESSKIIRLFSRELGLISALARGAKRPKSKMQNISSLYSVSEFSLLRKGDFYHIKEGRVIDLNEGLRGDIRSIYCAQLCVDLVEKSVMDHQVNRELFDLLVKTIQAIASTQSRIRLMSMFVIKWISMMGYKPQLKQCVDCGKMPSPIAFSINKGGLSCLDHGGTVLELSQLEYKYLIWLLYSKLEKVDSLDVAIDEKKLFVMLIDFALEQVGMKRPRVLDAFYRFMLN